MAILKLNDFASGDANLEAIMSTLNATYRGYHGMTITAFDTDSIPSVSTGSLFDSNGELIIVTELTNINDWNVPSIGGDVYIKFDPVANAFYFTGGSPVWDSQKGGWYIGNERVLFSGYKPNSSQMSRKSALKHSFGSSKNYTLNQDLNDYNAPKFAALEANGDNILHGSYSQDLIYGRFNDTEEKSGKNSFDVHGTIENSSGQAINVTYAGRTVSNIYVIYGWNLVTGAPDTLVITDGSGTFHDCSMIW